MYCDTCGTKRGEGKFKPHRNRPSIIYGPPIRITHHCSSCGNTWQKFGMNIKPASSCPKCGASFVDYLTDRPKPKGTVVGSYFEKNEPVQKISEAEVEKLLDLREKYKEDKQHVLEGNEACVTTKNPVCFIERSWDATNKRVVSTEKRMMGFKIDGEDIPREGEYKEVTNAPGDSPNEWFRMGGYSNMTFSFI